MEFIGAASGAGGRIPAPNWNLTPEALCKNYPFEFLMQPIIPLLSPPTSEEPSFCLSFPALKDACLQISRNIPKPTLHIIGVGILATCASYGVWKVSLKLCSGIFDREPDADPDTEKLDDEVAKILSIIEEECIMPDSVSCSEMTSQRDLLRYSSNTEGLSQGTPCSCSVEVGKPLKQLKSRIDQVMSRVEVVISSLKVLEDNMTSPKKDSDRGDERGRECNTVDPMPLGREKANVIGVSASDCQCEKDKEMVDIGTKAHLMEPNSLFGSVARTKTPDMSCMSGLGTGDREEDLVSIQQRIKNLEHRVESMNVSLEDKLSPYESMQSSFCSDRWDKSSSVSVISEYNPQFVNAASSPKTLPITVQSLMSPSPQFDGLTPPSDRRKSGGFKNPKRNTRSRSNSFMQFPTIEEDPLKSIQKHDKNIICPKLNEGVCVAGAAGSEAGPVFSIDSSPDGGLIFPRQGNNISGVKRQDTWPGHNNQHNNSKSHFTFPKINTDRSCFRQSENSCFEATKPRVEKIKKPQEQRPGRTKLPSAVSASQHCQGFTRHSKINIKMPSDFDFGSSSPAKVDVVSINKLSREEKMPKNESNGVSSSEHFVKTQTSQLPIVQNNRLATEPETDCSGGLKAPKHKLEACDVDAPPRKLSRGKVVASTTCGCVNPSSKPELRAEQETKGGNELSAPRKNYERLKRLSPFKRSSKKNTDFHVKYINNKGGDETVKDSTAGTGEKEDEWIVIVPRESES